MRENITEDLISTKGVLASVGWGEAWQTYLSVQPRAMSQGNSPGNRVEECYFLFIIFVLSVWVLASEGW